MLKYLLVILSFYSALAVAYEGPTAFEHDDALTIEFDDFPNNSIPDLESFFEES